MIQQIIIINQSEEQLMLQLSDAALVDLHGNNNNLYKVLNTGNIVNVYENASNEHALIYLSGTMNTSVYAGIQSLINSIQKNDKCSISGDINVIKNLDL